MIKYIIKRILLGILTFVIIFVMVFVLIKLLPMEGPVGTTTQRELVWKRREAMGYVDADRNPMPIMYQFVRYLRQLFIFGSWGLGEQMYPAQPVWGIFLQKLPVSMYVNLFSALLAVPIGLGLGVWAALRKNKLADNVISTSVMLGISVPGFVFGILIQYFLCFRWRIFPPLISPNTGDMWTAGYFWTALPAILALSTGTIAGYARYTRAELTEQLTNEYMLLARTKGLTKFQATMRHALKNSMVVIFPSLLMEIVGLLYGSMIIETIFGIPGEGALYLNSISAKDYNFFMMLSAFYTAIGLLSGIVGDLSYQIIDPRIRMGSKAR
jgi:oligopeptide transport system permease protein